jgi:hypothetical protein
MLAPFANLQNFGGSLKTSRLRPISILESPIQKIAIPQYNRNRRAFAKASQP